MKKLNHIFKAKYGSPSHHVNMAKSPDAATRIAVVPYASKDVVDTMKHDTNHEVIAHVVTHGNDETIKHVVAHQPWHVLNRISSESFSPARRAGRFYHHLATDPDPEKRELAARNGQKEHRAMLLNDPNDTVRGEAHRLKVAFKE